MVTGPQLGQPRPLPIPPHHPCVAIQPLVDHRTYAFANRVGCAGEGQCPLIGNKVQKPCVRAMSNPLNNIRIVNDALSKDCAGRLLIRASDMDLTPLIQLQTIIEL